MSRVNGGNIGSAPVPSTLFTGGVVIAAAGDTPGPADACAYLRGVTSRFGIRGVSAGAGVINWRGSSTNCGWPGGGKVAAVAGRGGFSAALATEDAGAALS